MSSSPQRRNSLIAKKACTRCSTQKRRRNRALPHCGLCTRLGQKCKYDPSRGSSATTPSISPQQQAGVFLGSEAFTPSHLKDAISQQLKARLLTPEGALSTYSRAIEPWFPILSIPRLRSRLSSTWEAVPLDIALLCLSIVLLASTPLPTVEDENRQSAFKSLYHSTKSSIASTETLGINSFPIVQSRILVALFEVLHGFHAAAYISAGAAFRAADALEVHPTKVDCALDSLDAKPNAENTLLIWSGISILDRYITAESSPYPSLTRSRTQYLDDLLKPSICPTRQQNQDKQNPIYRIARLFEASSLLDKIHTTLNSPTAEHAFNMEELVLVVQTLTNLQSLLVEEVGGGIPLYSGGLSLCKTALLVAFENGTKVPPTGFTDSCNSTAIQFIIPLLSTIVDMIEPFTLSPQSIDFNLLPPFVIFLVYKAALIVTERLWIDGDSNEGLRKLRTLRIFLGIVGERWLAGDRYLKLLNEDTTPRILRALEQG